MAADEFVDIVQRMSLMRRIRRVHVVFIQSPSIFILAAETSR
jgi:hypothetical protein